MGKRRWRIFLFFVFCFVRIPNADGMKCGFRGRLVDGKGLLCVQKLEKMAEVGS